MIVKDLIDICSPALVISLLLKRHGKEGMEEDMKEDIKEAYFHVYEELSQRVSTPSDYLLLKISYLDGDEVLPSLSLFSKKEIEEKKKEILELEKIEIKKEYTEEEIRHLISSRPETYSFTLTPWSEVLGFELDKRNVIEYGKENILADILYDITFFGFSEEEIEKERELLEKTSKAAEEQIKKEIEEGKEDSREIDEVFADFSFLKERTKEEKMEAEKRIYKEIAWNTKNSAKILKKILETY